MNIEHLQYEQVYLVLAFLHSLAYPVQALISDKKPAYKGSEKRRLILFNVPITQYPR